MGRRHPCTNRYKLIFKSLQQADHHGGQVWDHGGHCWDHGGHVWDHGGHFGIMVINAVVVIFHGFALPAWPYVYQSTNHSNNRWIDTSDDFNIALSLHRWRLTRLRVLGSLSRCYIKSALGELNHHRLVLLQVRQASCHLRSEQVGRGVVI